MDHIPAMWAQVQKRSTRILVAFHRNQQIETRNTHVFQLCIFKKAQEVITVKFQIQIFSAGLL